MSAPERLLEDEAISSKLRTDLKQARDHSEGRYDVAVGLAALQGAIAGGAVAGGTSSGGTGLGLKLILGSGVVAGVVFALWPAPESGPQVELQPTERSASVVVEPEENPALLETEVTPAAEQPDEPEIEAPPVVAPKKALAPQVDPDELMKLEIAHLKKVRAASSADPGRAISLAREGHRTFAKGILYEEREGLLILSLQKTGNMGEATTRAQKFAVRFPKSPLLGKMQSLLKVSPQ